MKNSEKNLPSRPLGLFGQVVIGPPGSGKSTYCAAMQEFLLQLGRKVAVVNLDPANDTLPYTCAVDLKDLIRLDEVMQSLHLGPNGGLLYYRLTKLKRDYPKTYVLFDCPGQVELYCVNGAFRKLLFFLTLTPLPTNTTLGSKQQDLSLPEPDMEAPSQSNLPGLGLRLSSVHLVDSYYCTSPGKFISVLLTSLVSMLQLGLPHVNVLSKIDLIEQYAPLKFNLDFFTEVLDLSYLVEQLDDVPFFAKYKKLNGRLAELVQDTALVNFLILDVQDRTHLEKIMRHTDKGNGYVFGTDEQRTLQSMLSCASGAEFSNDLVCLAQEKYTHQSSKAKNPH
ncbi:GPN-loop GTPase 2 [Sparganum proliferum]